MAMALMSFAGQGVNSLVYHAGDGYFYHLNNNRPNRTFAYLRCIYYHRQHNPCWGTASAILEQDLIYHKSAHSHNPEVHLPLVRALKNDIFKRVSDGDQTSFQEIIQQEGQKYPMEVRAKVGYGSIVSRLNKLRSNLRPPVPRSLGVLGACLLLPEYEYLTKCQHVPDSLFAGMCGSMPDGTLSLVFISPEMKTFMQTRSMIFADGTERKLFQRPRASQIYVISASWRFHAIVMVRAIMLRRTETAYNVLFDFLKALMPHFKPTAIKCDFEDAQVNSWRSRFPNANVQGCLWHFDVAVYTHPKNKLGLFHLIKTEEEVSSIIRSAGALPLLPTHQIMQGLLELGQEAVDKGWMPQLRLFFKYLDKEWIPKIPVLSVKGSKHRTNNVAESTNRAFNKMVKVSNPSCFTVLSAFVALNDKYTVDYHTLQDPTVVPGRGRKISALRNDRCIKRLTLDLENEDISILEFLHKASRRMQNVFNKVYNK